MSVRKIIELVCGRDALNGNNGYSNVGGLHLHADNATNKSEEDELKT
jgi:hypothetical protein